MAAHLKASAYGKSQVRLTKVTRRADRHDLKEISVDILLEGNFDRSYTHGDNSLLVATDTMKNTVYALAKNHPLESIESFGAHLADHFLSRNAHLTAVTIDIAEQPWNRIDVKGKAHSHAFVGGGSEQRITNLRKTREGTRIESGVSGLLVLKTTDSAFTGFIRDEYTTLADTNDRIFATSVTAKWIYSSDRADYNASYEKIRKAMLEVFATHKSLGVQQTLYAMGEAALDVCGEISEIHLEMPNQHRLLINLAPFKMDNPNEIFVPTNEPFGLITATVARK